MSDGPAVRRGDVVVIRLDPAEGHEMKKSRPAVVVQNDVGNGNSSTTILASVTGTYRGYPFEVLVEAAESPFEKDSSDDSTRFESSPSTDESVRWSGASTRRP